jgi:hypothetical protein
MPNASIHVEGQERDDDEDHKIRRGELPVAGGSFGRMRRIVRGAGSGLRFFLVSASTIGMLLMVAYELQYIWTIQIPWSNWDVSEFVANFGWNGALIMILVYVGLKVPHLVGQEPGDHWSLIREVLYGVVNIAVAVVFLTGVSWGLPAHDHSSPIFRLLLVVFVAMIVCEIIVAMRLTSRSWQNQAGGQGT